MKRVFRQEESALSQTRPVLCLLGPTSCGKTNIAIELAHQFPVDIISVDSAMIYTHMNIGTAKPSAELLAQIPHQLINIRQPHEAYSAAQFCADATQAIDHSHQRQRIPLLVGGTMLYFRSLQQGLCALPSADSHIRTALLAAAHEQGWASLHEQLRQIDPVAAARIHPHDPQRLIRALEVYQLTGKSLSEHWQQQPRTSLPYHFINLIIFPEQRALLHQRIAVRFEQMLQQGLIDEVQQLVQQFQLTREHAAMRAVGYRQVYEYLTDHHQLDTLRAQAVAATRQLAKRQLTWLRQWSAAHYFNENNLSEIPRYIRSLA